MKNNITGQLYALKTFSTRNHEIIRTIKEEYLNTKALDHPNLLRYHELYINTYQAKVHLLMDYFSDMNLLEYIRASKVFDEYLVKSIARQLFEVVQYLHNRGVVHRDIKPENILVKAWSLSSNLEIRLIDFSVSAFNKNIGSSSSTIKYRMSDRVGTRAYRAPETFNQLEYNEGIDVWGISCTLYECIFGEKLIAKGSIIDLLANQSNWNLIINKIRFSVSLSAELRNFLEKTFEIDPSQRITVSRALRHDFIINKQEYGIVQQPQFKRYSCLNVLLTCEMGLSPIVTRMRLKSFS